MNGVKYSTEIFSNIYSTADSFLNDYHNVGFPILLSDDQVKLVYLLLIGDFANNPIINEDINQFKVKLYSRLYQYGPNYFKKMEIQKLIRSLSEEEIRMGSVNINNVAKNNDSLPSDQSTEELTFINNQLVNKWKKSPIEAYTALYSLLHDDYTRSFLDKFKVLFKISVDAEVPDLYIKEE